MIDITKFIITTAKANATLSSRVYRGHPSATPTAPYCTVDILGRTCDLLLAGEEIIVTYTYSVDVYADKQSSAESISLALASAFAPYNIIHAGMYVGYLSDVDLHKASNTFRVTVDKRDNAYINQ